LQLNSVYFYKYNMGLTCSIFVSLYDESMLLKHNYSENYIAVLHIYFSQHWYQQLDATDVRCPMWELA